MDIKGPAPLRSLSLDDLRRLIDEGVSGLQREAASDASEAGPAERVADRDRGESLLAVAVWDAPRGPRRLDVDAVLPAADPSGDIAGRVDAGCAQILDGLR